MEPLAAAERTQGRREMNRGPVLSIDFGSSRTKVACLDEHGVRNDFHGEWNYAIHPRIKIDTVNS